MNKKYRITNENEWHNECTMHISADEGNSAYTRYFWAPDDGGYVYEVFENRPGTSGQQVCDDLCSTGATLRWAGGSPLIRLIRYEAKRRYRRQDAARRREERDGYGAPRKLQTAR